MYKNLNFFLLCPVPDNQKPINEYFELMDNFLLNILDLNSKKFNIKIYIFFLMIFMFYLPILFILNKNKVSIFEMLFQDIFLTNFTLILILLSIYFLWKSLENRFKNSKIFYEEGSWYDGKIWFKSFDIIKNDLFISTQKIQPILKKLKKYIYINIILGLLFYIFSIF